MMWGPSGSAKGLVYSSTVADGSGSSLQVHHGGGDLERQALSSGFLIVISGSVVNQVTGEHLAQCRFNKHKKLAHSGACVILAAVYPPKSHRLVT